MFNSFALALAVAAALLFSSCARGSAGPDTGSDAENLPRYDLKGTVVSVERAKGTVTIDHEEIPGYMPAMRMPFPVKDADVLASFEPGDVVWATMVVGDRGYWLENISVMKGGAAPPPAGSGAEPAPGSRPPAVSLVNQDGKPLKLQDAKGAARVVTFIYTRCPLPDYCILMSEHFAALNRSLAADPELRDRVRLLSVTLDPAFDTPEVLREYGARYAGGGPDAFARWDFATGQPGEIRRLAEYLGLSYKEDGGQILHTLSTAVFAPDGTLRKLYRGNEWKPAQIHEELRAALSSS
ncbi:MAG TPA: SCO family protein [Pyrinomonadaceae bacterium]|nr:SCO family protein [Pyrinomonadaceae bacterium]